MTWVKMSNVMPQPKSVPPGKGGKPCGKKSKSFDKIWYGLTIHIHSQIDKKYFSNLCFVLRSNLQQIMQILRNSSQISRTIY